MAKAGILEQCFIEQDGSEKVTEDAQIKEKMWDQISKIFVDVLNQRTVASGKVFLIALNIEASQLSRTILGKEELPRIAEGSRASIYVNSNKSNCSQWRPLLSHYKFSIG